MIELPSERSVQRAILKMAGTCFPRVIIHHSPNGAHLAGNNTARFKQMGALLGDGLKKGFPDLIALWAHGNGCLIECKRPKLGKLSDTQKAMHEALEAIGWPVAVVTSPDEAFDVLRAAGAPWNGIPWRVAA